MKIFKTSLDQIQVVSDYLTTQFNEKQIVLLSGPLGAGKTELVKNVLGTLSIDDVHSPTYSLIHEYHAKSQEIYHIDLYRVEGDEELESIGFWDLFDNENAIVFIEWPERMNIHSLPLHWSKIHVQIEKDQDKNLRLYRITKS